MALPGAGSFSTGATANKQTNLPSEKVHSWNQVLKLGLLDLLPLPPIMLSTMVSCPTRILWP